MDLRRQEFTRGGPPGWRPGDSEPRAFRSHLRGHVSHFPKSDEAPRRRTPVDDRPDLPPNPDHFPSNPSYPPGFDNRHRSPAGFDNGHRSPPGFDNGHRSPPGFDNNHRNRSGFDRNHRNRSGFGNCHGEMMVQESVDGPCLPPHRRAPPGGSHLSGQIARGDDQDVKVEFCGPSQSRPGSVAEASEGRPSELVGDEKAKKRKKRGGDDAQPAERSSSADNSYERTTKVCHKLWRELDVAIQQRERDLREKEDSFTPSTINKEVLEEEKKQTAAMKNDVMEERRRLEEEAQRIRKEKDAMERTSNELAVQMVELKQVQRQLEKEKAALLARKAQ